MVIAHPGVDAYLAGLPDWQRGICERLREMIRATDPRVSDPHGVINQGHGNAIARAIQIYRDDEIVANNRRGGWRRLSRG